MSALKLVRAFLDGLVLRCPRCHQGRMFERAFRMRRACLLCGLPFESATGENVGGMGVNTIATCTLVVSLAVAFLFIRGVPLMYPILGLVLVGFVFPILFYRSSRGIWVSFLYLTGNHTERDWHGR